MKPQIEPLQMWKSTRQMLGGLVCHVCGRSKSYAGKGYTDRTLKLHITKVHGRHYHKGRYKSKLKKSR